MEERKQFSQLFGKQLRVTRKQAGLSLDRVAHRTNLSAKHLGRIEHDEKIPLLLTVAILCKVLHVNATLDNICSELDEHSDN